MAGGLVLGGLTSGSVTLDPPNVAGSTVITLPSTSGTMITTASSGQSIPKAALPTGSVLQVVSATYSTQSSTSSSSFTDTGVTATITPTSASSKILVVVHLNDCQKSTNNTFMGVRLLRGASTISTLASVVAYTATTTTNNIGSISTSYLDSPATTSATTYKVQYSSLGNLASVFINAYAGADTTMSTITLMEIAA